MHFSTIGILCSLLVLPSFASPVETRNPTSLAADTSGNESWIGKRCCILFDNPYARCGANDKREAVETEEEALFGPEKRCCILCNSPNARCKRGETPAQWPEKRCCINYDNPYARCDGTSASGGCQPVDTLEEPVEGLN
ncbi:hypothetical protein BDV32DRAFT_148830 [Aspergillus pseudonomiae]|uniref:Uncharacterized protein n=1 Tax=Aspergillus pseudonomiae TaxID=1506151 RepID=A0A5N6I2X3_9EURO|nr:uncharacterized protein BDV37DRAFT_282384 [Aspergillus pseudonomiae]KAB8260956.1 hypothetical protein BDV32DRAFT_148830 [Aspergillus pseudonomiae]KAE8404851.1 hypothetical protein BDV37DRAFT_282384 [Aspergillus pseudonomiae]